jgi:preprotein translocase subunit SecE
VAVSSGQKRRFLPAVDVAKSAEIAGSDFGQSTQASSSIGRAAVSKTAGWGFDSLLACHRLQVNDIQKAQTSGTADHLKLGVAVVLLIGGVVAYYVLGNSESTWLRWVAVGLGIVLAAAVLVPSKYGTDFKQFVVDSRVELRKVVWPTRKETGMTTLVVFGFAVFAGVFFWLVDLVLAWAMRHITGQGG